MYKMRSLGATITTTAVAADAASEQAGAPFRIHATPIESLALITSQGDMHFRRNLIDWKLILSFWPYFVHVLLEGKKVN